MKYSDRGKGLRGKHSSLFGEDHDTTQAQAQAQDQDADNTEHKQVSSLSLFLGEDSDEDKNQEDQDANKAQQSKLDDFCPEEEQVSCENSKKKIYVCHFKDDGSASTICVDKKDIAATIDSKSAKVPKADAKVKGYNRHEHDYCGQCTASPSSVPSLSPSESPSSLPSESPSDKPSSPPIPNPNENATNRGQVQKFELDEKGTVDVELCSEEDCPKSKFECKLNPGNGPNNANALWCQSESKSTSMTIVSADCPNSDTDTDCAATAASIVEEETGRVWSLYPDGSVVVIEQADFPPEGKHKYKYNFLRTRQRCHSFSLHVHQHTLPMKMNLLRKTRKPKGALSEGCHSRNALFKVEGSLGSVFLLSIRRVQSKMTRWVS
jgi:hypothetical protein